MLDFSALQNLTPITPPPDPLDRMAKLVALQNQKVQGQRSQLDLQNAQKTEADTQAIHDALIDSIDPNTQQVDIQKAAPRIMAINPTLAQPIIEGLTKFNEGKRNEQIENMKMQQGQVAPSVQVPGATVIPSPIPNSLDNPSSMMQPPSTQLPSQSVEVRPQPAQIQNVYGGGSTTVPIITMQDALRQQAIKTEQERLLAPPVFAPAGSQPFTANPGGGYSPSGIQVPPVPSPEIQVLNAWIKEHPITNGHPSTLADAQEAGKLISPDNSATEKEFADFQAHKAAKDPAFAKYPNDRIGLAQWKADTGTAGKITVLNETTGSNDPRLANVTPDARKDVLDKVQKVEDTFTGAQAAADNMNTFINMAKAGNKEAYAYSPVEGVLQINTGRGVKRINRQEIEQYAGAGSLFDRIAGAVGKQVSGASIPANVLNDMQSLHNAITANAQATHDRSLQSIDKTYRSKFAPEGGMTSPAGFSFVYQGKTLTFPTQKALDDAKTHVGAQ